MEKCIADQQPAGLRTYLEQTSSQMIFKQGLLVMSESCQKSVDMCLFVCVRFTFFFEWVGPGLYAMDEKVTMLTLQIGCPIS